MKKRKIIDIFYKVSIINKFFFYIILLQKNISFILQFFSFDSKKLLKNLKKKKKNFI
jgi:hypothetical protein